MKQVLYLSLEEIIYLHEEIIKVSGGSEGIRDFGLLHAACERPKASFGGEDLYPTIFTKAGALVHSLILNHAFVDGNKRIAVASLIRFCFINNLKLTATPKQLINLALKNESKTWNIDEISDWLIKHSK